jgi:hypothetical protein
MPDKSAFLFQNWRAALQEKEVRGCFECPLYSDAWMVGDEKIGPYWLMNTLAHASSGAQDAVAPVFVLRVDIHTQFDEPQMHKTDTSVYHGGSLSDEVAALAALSMGARVKAGPVTRQFLPGDARGRPIAHDGYGLPTLSCGKRGRTLPWAVGRHSLEDLSWLTWFEADPRDQVALIRAARLYQDAIWIADSEPAMAWLLLVSAIETAANRWDRPQPSATERLRYSKPTLVETIEARCPELLPIIADEIADTIGATRKFVRFTLEFLPPPPPERPAPADQIVWEKEHLDRILKKIYGYRSKALHTGIPFPAPMCESPRAFSAGSIVPTERPWGLAASALGGVWLQEDTPMSLHIFDYITRKSLRSWWSSLRPVQDGAPEGS